MTTGNKTTVEMKSQDAKVASSDDSRMNLHKENSRFNLRHLLPVRHMAGGKRGKKYLKKLRVVAI